MIVFNTTYLVAEKIEKEWIEWVKSNLIPTALEGNILSNPHLYKIMAKQEEGVSYSLQFSAKNVADMKHWQVEKEIIIDNLISKTFGESVLFFKTYLKEII